MPCNDCGNKKQKCGCTSESLSINQICNPVTCPTDECAESFSASCIRYTGADLTCGNVVVVPQNTNIDQAISNIISYVCANDTIDVDLSCGATVVVPTGTLVEDALPMIINYFCTEIANITLTPGPQGPQGVQGDPGVDGVDGVDGQGIDHVSFTSSTGASQGLPGETDTYTVWGDVGETINLGSFLVTNGADGATGPQGPAGTGGGLTPNKFSNNGGVTLPAVINNHHIVDNQHPSNATTYELPLTASVGDTIKFTVLDGVSRIKSLGTAELVYGTGHLSAPTVLSAADYFAIGEGESLEVTYVGAKAIGGFDRWIVTNFQTFDGYGGTLRVNI